MPLSHVNPENYATLLQQKAQRISEQFKVFNPPTIQVFDSPPLHFRQRAEFRIWHQDQQSHYVMFNKEQPKTPVFIEQFPIGSQRLNAAMHDVMTWVARHDVLRQRLFQVEFLTTLSGEALVTLIYHRPLDEQWLQLAGEMQAQLQLKIIGRSKKQRLVLSDDFVTEVLTVAGNSYRYQQVENSFTQPNASVNQKMLEWALEHSKKLGGDLLELYCGNGNFTTVLAQNFDHVLATEISKTSVKSARHNFEQNAVHNVEIVRMSSEEFSAAMDGEREFRRLRGIELNNYRFSTILVDPPRAGLDEHTEKLTARFDHILYISCNPTTLYRNLQHLCQTHTIEQFALFDQFPYTDHIECGVLLKRTGN